MPYVSNETVSSVRQALKAEFPNVKFSVRKQHHTSIDVAVMSGPFAFESLEYAAPGYQINHFHPHLYEGWVESEFIQRLVEIVRSSQRVTHYDYDYGNIPNHYVSISIGRWDRPYVQN